MGKKKAALKASLASTDSENNGSGAVQQLLLPGSTLEDYFHSKKFDPKRDLPVSKHLLVGTPTNNAMAMEREDDTGAAGVVVATAEGSNSVPEVHRASEKQHGGSSDDRADHGQSAGPSDAKAKSSVITAHVHARSDTKDAGADDAKDEVEADDGASDCSHHDEYEDDYESESPSPDTSVAGMTLSDYLQAKEAGNTQDDDSSDGACHGVAGKRQGAGAAAAAKTKKLESAAAAPKKPTAAAASGAKKASAPVVITGMSLDHYLGASSAVDSDSHGAGGDCGDPLDSDADSKSPTLRRKKSKAGKTAGAKALLAAMPKHSTGSSSASPAHLDEHVTPFQKRQTKKLRAKLKQQQQQSSGGSVSKSMLLAEPGALALQTKAIALSATIAACSSTSSLVKDKDRRRSSQQQQQQQQSSHQAAQHPLPKLVALSSSSLAPAHTLAAHRDPHLQHHSHDADDSSGSAGDDDESEKLPPLPHY